MSVQQQIDRINTEVSSQETLLDRALLALQNKAAGGGDGAAEDGIITREISGTYSNSRVTSIGAYCFYGCKNLEHAEFQNVKSITGNYAFVNNSSLVSIKLPSLISATGQQIFYTCTALTTVEMPSLTTLTSASYFLANCRSLVAVDFPSLTNIPPSCFSSDTNLTTLILRLDIVCVLENTNAFNNTPIANGTGYIYVPSALVEQYKAATNWSTYAAQFRALEDYTVDGTTTGELDESKI